MTGVLLFAVCLLFAMLLFFWYVIFYEPNHFILRERVIHSPKVKSEVSILHLSDLHIDHARPSLLFSFMKKLAAKKADIIVMTGDLTNSDIGLNGLKESIRLLNHKNIFAVLGNHDYYIYDFLYSFSPALSPRKPRDISKTIKCLDQCGVKLLKNRSVLLKRYNMKLWGIEYTDHYDSVPQLPNLKSSAKSYNCLLVHTPDLIPRIADWGNIDLFMAGHTHGGQVRLPGIGHVFSRTRFLKGMRRLVDGLNRYKGSMIHISRGLGQGITMRFRCYPEAVLLKIMP